MLHINSSWQSESKKVVINIWTYSNRVENPVNWKYIVAFNWIKLILPHLDASTIKGGEMLGRMAVLIDECKIMSGIVEGM